jgi:hypothetical protein
MMYMHERERTQIPCNTISISRDRCLSGRHSSGQDAQSSLGDKKKEKEKGAVKKVEAPQKVPCLWQNDIGKLDSLCWLSMQICIHPTPEECRSAGKGGADLHRCRSGGAW